MKAKQFNEVVTSMAIGVILDGANKESLEKDIEVLGTEDGAKEFNEQGYMMTADFWKDVLECALSLKEGDTFGKVAWHMQNNVRPYDRDGQPKMSEY